MIILIVLFIAWAVCECASIVSLGPPWFTIPQQHIRRMIQTSKLNGRLLSCEKGYIGEAVVAMYYYCEGHVSRIPIWSPIYWEARARLKMLRRQNRDSLFKSQ